MSTRRIHNEKTLSALSEISGKKLTLGNFLWAIRMADEISQADFAKTLGVSRQYLCDIERGRRFISPKVAAGFAEVLGYSVQQFVRLCLQDIVDRDGVSVHIEVKAA